LAIGYFKDAHYQYSRWQAQAKVADLEARYPELFPKTRPSNSWADTVSTTTTTSVTSSNSGLALDLATVIKASQAIGNEIVLEQLLTKLMKIIIENAGAQTGVLLLETHNQFFIEAEGTTGDENVAVLQSIPLENRLPLSIINYVLRTGKIIVLADATGDRNFARDAYIQQHQPQSILCFPISDLGKLIGIVYLENNLTQGTFTPDRVEVLKILSAQAAISIENARLYQTLEDKVKERTAQTAAANTEIRALNERLKDENLRMGAELEVTKELKKRILPNPEE
jgi:GAF domain-containing protein